MTNQMLPWVIGPVPLIGTILSAAVFLGNVITRKGLTVGSLFASIVLTAFIVGYAELITQPPLQPWLTIALAQVAGVPILGIFLVVLRSVQANRKPLRNPDWGPLRNGIGKAVAFLALWNGLTILFFNTGCEDLTYSADYEKCYTGEKILGMHGPFLNVFIVVLFGVPSLCMIGFGIIGSFWKQRQDARKAATLSDQRIREVRDTTKPPP
ncbi:hypothetical protein [Neorhizobium sp. P12A]|uniref:hypothetical protein n=1 Tax=Neorhizobium sp. P12A TaxID=2268027 RepID=UPI0011EC26D2|nr:hypothetical protein [Neorhizobium sp. P12A]